MKPSNIDTLLFDFDFLDQIKEFNTLLVGFSGGLDSTVLLHNLSKVIKKNFSVNTQFPTSKTLIALHINHQISANAEYWQMHCQKVCKQLDVPIIIKKVLIPLKKNIEEQARTVRHSVFLNYLRQHSSQDNKIALILGHHQNDQAETLLLQLFRGAGIMGMASMPSIKTLGNGRLFRPFLDFARSKLEDYARANSLEWVEDESNADIHFSRNYIRHQILPLIQERWPGVLKSLSRTGKHCEEAQSNLEYLAKKDFPDFCWDSKQFPLEKLNLNLPQARIANILRLWFSCNGVRPPSVQLMNQVQYNVIQAAHDAQPKLYLGKHIWVKRYCRQLYLIVDEVANNKDSFNQVNLIEKKSKTKFLDWTSFPQPLNLGSEIGQLCPQAVTEKGILFPARSSIKVCFREGGEAFYWRGQTKRLKKLFQEWQVPPWQRDKIPLIYINEQLACVVGYAISDHFYQSQSEASNTEKKILKGYRINLTHSFSNIQDD